MAGLKPCATDIKNDRHQERPIIKNDRTKSVLQAGSAGVLRRGEMREHQRGGGGGVQWILEDT
jgi:hypothetical protein